MSAEIEIFDLGAITEMTKGAYSMVLQELGTPPFNWMFLAPGYPVSPPSEITAHY